MMSVLAVHLPLLVTTLTYGLVPNAYGYTGHDSKEQPLTGCPNKDILPTFVAAKSSLCLYYECWQGTATLRPCSPGTQLPADYVTGRLNPCTVYTGGSSCERYNKPSKLPHPTTKGDDSYSPDCGEEHGGGKGKDTADYPSAKANYQTKPEYDACDLSPCLNGGTCHIQVGGYWCECPYGYMGSLQCHATTAPPPPPPPTYGGKTHYTTALPTTTYSPDYNAACPSVAGYGGFRACRSVCSPDYECGRGEVCCPNACGGSYCYRLPTQGYNRMSNYGPSPLSGDYGSASPIGGLSGLQYLVGNPKKTAIGLLNPHVNINNLKDPSYLLSTYGDGN